MRSTCLVLLLAVVFCAIGGCDPPDAPPEVAPEGGGPCPAAPSLCSAPSDQAACGGRLLVGAMCYPDAGPDPLPELAGDFPAYGCAPVLDGGVESRVWCCSKLTPGTIDRPCGPCRDWHCLY